VGNPAYVAALRLLARSELSEAQVRVRLARRGHDGPAIEAALARLKSERSLDDRRAALAIARAEAGRRGRGRRRVLQRLAAAGIADDIASRAIEDVFESIDEDALLRAALDRRLRGATTVAGDRAFARLYRQLTGQGFDHGRVMALLKRLPRATDTGS